RRADLASYLRLVEIASESALVVRLTSSFRSAPSLVHWINQRFANILAPTDPDRVPYHPLTSGRRAGPQITVHVVPMELGDGNTAADARLLEAETMARYVRWLVAEGMTIDDPVTGEHRAIRSGD